jgi:dihydroxy-acid dehydratase
VAVRDGDTVELDTENRRIEVDLPQDEIDRRIVAWEPPPPKYEKGVMAKYARSVSSASLGAITR